MKMENFNPYPRIFSGTDAKSYRLWEYLLNLEMKHVFTSFVYRKMFYDKLILVGDAEFRRWFNTKYQKALYKTVALNRSSTKERELLYAMVKQKIFFKH